MGVAAHPLMTTLLRVAAVGDLHCTRTCEGAFQSLFAKIGESADVLVLCGDLTDYGTLEEAHILARELTPSLGDHVEPRLTSPFRLITIPATGKRVYVQWQGRP